MDKDIEILLLQFEQTDDSIWSEIVDFAAHWNRTRDIKFINEDLSELIIYFPDKEHKDLRDLEKILEQKETKNSWKWIKTITNNKSKADIEGHDYIQIIGDGYPDEFFVNEKKALSQKMICEKCGTIHPHLRNQESAIQINEDFLYMDMYPNNRHIPLGIDLVNMSHGALLVSKKVKNILRSNKDLKGYTLLDVLNQKGKVSVNMFQLKSDKVILLPDNILDKGEICPVCGSVLGTMTGDFVVEKSRLGGSSFFSRNSSGISSIYISKALYNVFQSENIRGLTPVQGADLIND